MSLSEGIITGVFALGGVVVQYFLSSLSAQRQSRYQEKMERLKHKRDLYAEVLLQARRVQRTLKEFSDGSGSNRMREALHIELNRLAELNAVLRLSAPVNISDDSVTLEEEMRRRSKSKDADLGPLPLAPLIAAFRADLGLLTGGTSDE